jgi:CheY-like chemotaxis protein
MAHTLAGIAVLLADDDADSREIVSFLLTQEGATVRAAQSAGEALELLIAWTPHVILLDLLMPVVDGYDLLSAIRNEPGMEDVPAVAITACAYPEDEARAFAAGFVAHVAKPFAASALLALVERLAQRPASDGLRTVQPIGVSTSESP